MHLDPALSRAKRMLPHVEWRSTTFVADDDDDDKTTSTMVVGG